MAAEQMKKFTSHLTCPICCELYKRPKYLACYHSYCEECLVKLQKGSDNITCPECRRTSAIPKGGIKGLPNNFFINRIVDEVALKEKITGEEEVRCNQCIREDPAFVLCFDCGAFLCNHCYESHKYSRDYQGHSVAQLKELRAEKKDITLRPKAKPLICQEHDMELIFYCDTCEQLVCQYCIMTDHNGHQHNTVKKMANKHRVELDKNMVPVETMIVELTMVCQKITDAGKKIQMLTNKINQQIDDYYDRLQLKLLQQKENLKKELQDISTQKKKAVSLQLEQIEHNKAQLESMKELNNAVIGGSDQEVLFMKKQISEDVKRLTNYYKELKTEPLESATMQFIPVEGWFPQFANLFYSDVDPLNSMVDKILPFAHLNKDFKFTILTKDAQGHICSNGGSKVIAQAQSSNTGNITTLVTRDNQDGSYEAFFVPKEVGEVKLSVIINGRYINGSPFTILVRNYLVLDMPSKVVNDDGKIGQSCGIAFGKNGQWAIADSTKHCVCIFNDQDQLTKKFGSQGKGNGEFSFPTGVAFDEDNNLYVVDNNNHRVQKFDVTAKYVLQFSSRGSGNGQLSYPLGLTIHNNRVYVADQCNNRISIFHCDGKFIHTIGQSSQLDKPFDVAVTNNNQLLIADFNHCISIFTLDGNYVKNFGTCGISEGQLSNPSSLTIDMYGFILVTERGNNRVSIFDKDGVFIHCFGSKGSSNGQFSSPYGIALSHNGSVYVNDCGNKRIQIFTNY